MLIFMKNVKFNNAQKYTTVMNVSNKKSIFGGHDRGASAGSKLDLEPQVNFVPKSSRKKRGRLDPWDILRSRLPPESNVFSFLFSFLFLFLAFGFFYKTFFFSFSFLSTLVFSYKYLFFFLSPFSCHLSPFCFLIFSFSISFLRFSFFFLNLTTKLITNLCLVS